jgi:hypothetical protein
VNMGFWLSSQAKTYEGGGFAKTSAAGTLKQQNMSAQKHACHSPSGMRFKGAWQLKIC